MRKVLSFFVLAGVLLASSCSLKEDFRGNDSDFATLSFTVGEPGVSATRAIGDGTSVDALYYAVYDDKGNFIADLAGNKVGTTFPTTVEITLAKGQTYKIAFWAQDKDCGAYSFGQYGDIENIYINYAGLNNDESRDAFFKTIDHKVVGDIALDVTLERPFAQINLGVTQEDWDNAAKAGIYVAQSKLVINNAATELNLFDGKVQDPTSVEYALANIPTQTLEVDLNKDGVKEAYKYLSLSYILVADQGQTANEEGMFGAESALVNATFSLETNKAPFEVKVDNLPVQRNWRTNVIGEVLTGDIKFNIDVDPIFDGDINYPSTAEEELRFAAANGGKVELSSDITLKTPIVVAEGTSMVLDLNGKTITTDLKQEGRHHYAIDNYGTLIIEGTGAINARGIENFGTMVINGDITITNVDTNGGSAIWNEGHLTINKGTFTTNETAGAESYGGALYTEEDCEAIINGGTFIANSQLTYAILNYGKTTINNATVRGKHGCVGSDKDNPGTTEIKGGTFQLMENPGVSDHCTYYCSSITGGNFTLGNNTDNGAQLFYESTIATGYHVIVNDGWSYVVPEEVDAVVTSSSELKTAIVNDATIVLTEGTYTLPSLSGKEGVVIIGTEGTVIGGNTSTGFGGNFGKNTTIKNVTFSGTSNGVRYSYAQGGESTFENCTFAGESTYGFHIDQSKGATFTFNNCVFSGFNAFAGDLVKTTFNHCTFENNGSYGHTNIWSVAYFNDCTWEAGASVGPRDNATLYFNGVEESWLHEF